MQELLFVITMLLKRYLNYFIITVEKYIYFLILANLHLDDHDITNFVG